MALRFSFWFPFNTTKRLAGAKQGMRNGMTLINHPTGSFLSSGLPVFIPTFPTNRSARKGMPTQKKPPRQPQTTLNLGNDSPHFGGYDRL